ncbi:YitT family protein [Mangrovibacterium lignilyticum]|uniref:YitT family protein n=1 Tax=Mangrovibacterium lignilyticum TaxID=2668052 RepID=UPI0013D5FBC1|nr:YitT family protein [Mangrovibacterium lignilyticum]
MVVKNKIHWKSIYSVKSIIYTVLGVLCAIVALKGFMMPNHFLDGGVTGLSILAHEFTHYNISIFLILFNIPFLVIGYHKISKTFAVRAFLAVLLLSVLMNYIDIPVVTNDKILIAVFGGFLIGLGVGLVIKGGGVIDGLEIIADYTNKKSGFSTGEIILLINTFIFLTAAFGLGIEPAMYSILTYFTAVKTSDYVVDGFEEYTALTVVSKHHEDVKHIIVNDFQRAIMVYKGERGYLPDSFDLKYDCDIVMSIVTRLEIHRIKNAILTKDPEAFFYVQSINEVKGGIVKQLRKH